jgi:hypothetical protein
MKHFWFMGLLQLLQTEQEGSNTYNEAIMVDVVSGGKQQPIEEQKAKESKDQTHLLCSHTAISPYLL